MLGWGDSAGPFLLAKEMPVCSGLTMLGHLDSGLVFQTILALPKMTLASPLSSSLLSPPNHQLWCIGQEHWELHSLSSNQPPKANSTNFYPLPIVPFLLPT